MKDRHVKRSIRLPVDLARRLADESRRRRASQAAIIEAALESWLSPDAAERLEGALSRRLDLTVRALDRLAWNIDLGNEAMAQFIRFWLLSNAPLPDSAMPAAQAIGKERWTRFVDALSRRMELGPRLRKELSDDFKATEGDFE